jgi:hypothetical protein
MIAASFCTPALGKGISAKEAEALEYGNAGRRGAIETAMFRGWWDVTSQLLDAASLLNLDLSTPVHQTASKIRQRLSVLADSIQKQEVSTGIPPAFEWAQSPDAVFLNVKFAHKLDTPATLGCESTAFHITTANGTAVGEGAPADAKGMNLRDPSRPLMTFRADCREKRKAFHLSLSLFGPVEPPPASAFAMAAVGRAVLTLKKSTPGVWPRLIASSKQKLGHMHLWWAMQEKYQTENDAFDRAAKKKAADTAAEVASAAAATEASPAGPTDDTPAEAAAAPSAVPTETPTPSVEDRFSTIRASFESRRTQELAAVSGWEREEMRTIDAEARKGKKEADALAREAKQRLDAKADKGRADTRAEAERRKVDVNAALDAELAAARKAFYEAEGLTVHEDMPTIIAPEAKTEL